MSIDTIVVLTGTSSTVVAESSDSVTIAQPAVVTVLAQPNLDQQQTIYTIGSTPGANGVNGWTPVTALVADGTRKVLQIVDWTGGAGTKPATGYIGALGIVANIGDAADLGSSGAVTSVNGQTGDVDITLATLGAASATQGAKADTAYSWGNHASVGYLITHQSLSGVVPITRKVNTKELSSDITLDATDVGARSNAWVPAWGDITGKPPVAADGGSANNQHFGDYSQGAITTGTNNVAVGYRSQEAMTTGNGNASYGAFTGQQLQSGNGNMIIGHGAGSALVSGNFNTLIGGYAGQYHLGVSLTALGYFAGQKVGSGSDSATTVANSIIIGHDSRAAADGDTNEVVVGYMGRGSGSNSTTLGNSSTTLTVINSNTVRLTGTKTPSSDTDTGIAGDITRDSDYLYVCKADNSWTKIPLSWTPATGGGSGNVDGGTAYSGPSVSVIDGGSA